MKKGALIHADNLPTIEIIPFQVHQLFINLISNAIKFVKPGAQPDIRITQRGLWTDSAFRMKKRQEISNTIRLLSTITALAS